MSKTIEKNANEKIEFITYLNNMLPEANPPTTPPGKSIPRNLMTSTEQPY